MIDLCSVEGFVGFLSCCCLDCRLWDVEIGGFDLRSVDWWCDHARRRRDGFRLFDEVVFELFIYLWTRSLVYDVIGAESCDSSFGKLDCDSNGFLY